MIIQPVLQYTYLLKSLVDPAEGETLADYFRRCVDLGLITEEEKLALIEGYWEHWHTDAFRITIKI